MLLCCCVVVSLVCCVVVLSCCRFVVRVCACVFVCLFDCYRVRLVRLLRRGVDMYVFCWFVVSLCCSVV